MGRQSLNEIINSMTDSENIKKLNWVTFHKLPKHPTVKNAVVLGFPTFDIGDKAISELTKWAKKHLYIIKEPDDISYTFHLTSTTEFTIKEFSIKVPHPMNADFTDFLSSQEPNKDFWLINGIYLPNKMGVVLTQEMSATICEGYTYIDRENFSLPHFLEKYN